jgi:alkylhydroperoxidase family enzyme
MARIAPIDASGRAELDSLVADIKLQRAGRVSPLYATLLHSEPITRGWLQLLTAVRTQTKIAAAFKELVILQVALLNRAPYEYRSHVPHALAAGVTQAQIDALPQWRDSTSFSAAQRAVLTYTEAMTRDVDVPEPVFAELRAHFDAQEIIELTTTVAAYNMVSRFLVALQVGH